MPTLACRAVAIALTAVCTLAANPACGIGLLLPAIQKVRDAASVQYPYQLVASTPGEIIPLAPFSTSRS